MKKIKNITKAINITKSDMLSFLKVSNLILLSTTIMLCISVIIFKENNWGNVTLASILLWASTMLLIMSASYYYYFEFQFSGENWLNFGGEEDEDMVDEGAYAEDEIEEIIEEGVPNKDIPLHITNENDKEVDMAAKHNQIANEIKEVREKYYQEDEFDAKAFHNDTINDILELINVCQDEVGETIVPTEKFDEIRQYTYKLQRYIK
jgi:hypothetical protein